MTLTPCELHEISNCAECSGAARAFESSLSTPPPDPDAPVPYIPGGVTIHARFGGTCAGCGQWYPEHSIIHRPQEFGQWYLVECCVTTGGPL